MNAIITPIEAAPQPDRYAAPDKLVQVTRPFVGTGRSVHRGDSAIDVLTLGVNYVDTSVIAVDALGLTLNSGDFRVVIAWPDVRSITVRGMADEETTSTREYRNAAATYPLRDDARRAA